MLKDGLRQAIRMSICNGVALEFDSINELMMLWYENSRGNIQYKDITYMGKELKIIYDVVTDDNGEVIEETDFITIRKDLEDQINMVNKLLEVK